MPITNNKRGQSYKYMEYVPKFQIIQLKIK